MDVSEEHIISIIMVEEKKLETSFKYSTAILPYSSTLKLK
jgi:hypothetical protein